MNLLDQSKPERAILFSLALNFETTADAQERSLEELAELARTAGAEVVGSVSQRRDRVDPAYCLGKGKVEELKDYIEATGANLAINDDELTPSQIRNLENYLDCRVIDRSLLILDIFAQRAMSHEGRLQVELAQLEYRLPRLQAAKGSLSRLGGGIGTRGPGETKLETDRRHIRRRMAQLNKQLDDWAGRRARQQARRSEALTVAVVGYTNMGKSTLINRLCKSELFVENKLFATLDTNLNRLYLPEVPRDVILSDTVGFIRKLPHSLVEAFKSTLEVAAKADLLLHVLDGADPEMTHLVQVSTQVLEDIGAGHVPTIYVINKMDRWSDGVPKDPELVPYLRAAAPEAPRVSVSAIDGTGISELREVLRDACLEVLGYRRSLNAPMKKQEEHQLFGARDRRTF